MYMSINMDYSYCLCLEDLGLIFINQCIVRFIWLLHSFQNCFLLKKNSSILCGRKVSMLEIKMYYVDCNQNLINYFDFFFAGIVLRHIFVHHRSILGK